MKVSVLLTWTRAPGSFMPLQGGTTPSAETRRDLGLPADRPFLLPTAPPQTPPSGSSHPNPGPKFGSSNAFPKPADSKPAAGGLGLGVSPPSRRASHAPHAPPTYVTSGRPLPALRPPRSSRLPLGRLCASAAASVAAPAPSPGLRCCRRGHPGVAYRAGPVPQPPL